jgi:hypothetical protein
MLAYIDPGLGGLVVQSIIAGFLTVLYFFRNSFNKLKSILGSFFSSKKKEANEK